MDINILKQRIKDIPKKNIVIEYGYTVFLAGLMVLQRFLSGVYKPVMDDWFVYGSVYKTAERMQDFAIPNEKFAIRPIAGIFDCYVHAPLFNHLWIAELILTFALLIGAFLIIKTMRRNNVAGVGFFLCLVCLFPVGLEATYWIAAATRISYSILFTGAAVFALDYYYKTKLNRGLILYAILGAICVGFYEPTIVIYIILTLFIVHSNYKNKRDLLPLILLCLHVGYIGIYYIINASSGEMELRGGLLQNNIFAHTSLVTGYMRDIFTKYTGTIISHGYIKGLQIVLDKEKLIEIILISLGFGVFSALAIKKRKFSVKILILGIALFIGGLSLNYILGSDRIPLRLVYFAFLGAGIILDELFMLFPMLLNRILCGIILSVAAFVFTVSGIGEVRDFQITSEMDVYIAEQIVALDTENDLTNPDKNTYVFGGQHYYEDTKCISWLDHIRGASGSYATMTGCIRHVLNTPHTNNILTFTYGDTRVLEPYINTEGHSTFYNIEYDKTVVRANLVPDGENYIIVRDDGSVIGELVRYGNMSHQFLN